VVAEEAMHPPEMLIQADALLSTTAARMTSRNVREAPVVASNGIVVGVLTIQNLERWYTRHSSQPGPQQP
jgi:CBS domain-containing protein